MCDSEPMVYKLLEPNMTVVKRQFSILAGTTKREREAILLPNLLIKTV